MDLNWPVEEKRELRNEFNKLYYGDFNAPGEVPPFATLRWRGVRILKCPEDLFMYQEIIHRTQPDVIIETGVAFGGSALYLADMCELNRCGSVIAIDITLANVSPETQRSLRIDLLEGDSASEKVAGWVSRRVDAMGLALKREPRTMVILDSDHTKAHVLKELELYAPFVSRGCYLIVEDTNINGHPVAPAWAQGPGPYEAVEEFLESRPEFDLERDLSCERLLVTFNPGGYLRRKP